MYVCMIFINDIVYNGQLEFCDGCAMHTCVVAKQYMKVSVYTVHMTLSHLGLVSDWCTCMYNNTFYV